MEETKSFWSKTSEELTMKDQMIVVTVVNAVVLAPVALMIGYGVVVNWKAKRAQKKLDAINQEDIIDIEI